MAKITGIGGIFVKCQNFDLMKTWYAEQLGLQIQDWGGAQFNFSDSQSDAYALFSLFKPDTPYFAPSEERVMFNLRVDDLDGFLLLLRERGVTIVGEPVDEGYGKFGWILDPEGNKIELWQQ